MNENSTLVHRYKGRLSPADFELAWRLREDQESCRYEEAIGVKRAVKGVLCLGFAMGKEANYARLSSSISETLKTLFGSAG